jgi:hypothetical protein
MDGPVTLDRDVYLKRWGHPSSWTGDWSRKGRYLRKFDQPNIQARLTANEQAIIGLAVRQVPSKSIAEAMGVSRESIDRRLRPLGLKNAPGQVGPPLKGTIDFAEMRNEHLSMLATRKVMFGSLCSAIAQEEGKTLQEIAAKVGGTPASQFTRWKRGDWTAIEHQKLVKLVRTITDDPRRQADLIIAYLVDLTPVEYRPQIDIGQRGEVLHGKSTSEELSGPWSKDIRNKLEVIGAAYSKDADFQKMVDTMAGWAKRIEKSE